MTFIKSEEGRSAAAGSLNQDLSRIETYMGCFLECSLWSRKIQDSYHIQSCVVCSRQSGNEELREGKRRKFDALWEGKNTICRLSIPMLQHFQITILNNIFSNTFCYVMLISFGCFVFCFVIGIFSNIDHCLVTEEKAGELRSYQITWIEAVVISNTDHFPYNCMERTDSRAFQPVFYFGMRHHWVK